MYKCFDENWKEDTLGYCTYVLINDYDEFLTACIREDIIVDGLAEAYEIAEHKCPFIVKLDKDYFEWDFVSPNDYPTWLSKEIAKSESESTNTNAKLYNLYVIFKSGTTLQTNTEPITFEDITEAIEVLQKPSIFGKQIAEFKIEVL